MRKQGFFERKGFYIILGLCVTAIGLAGYVNFAPETTNDEQLKINTLVESLSSETVNQKQENIAKPEVIEPEPIEINDNTPEPIVEEKKEPVVEIKEQQVEVTSKNKEFLYLYPVSNNEIIKENSKDELVQDISMNDWRTHNATDFSVKSGEKVMAIANGTVKSIENSDMFGTIIVIEHDDGMITKTCGLNAETVAKIDKKVVAGDVIGTAMGLFPAEQNQGEHIHIEAIKDGVNFDIAELFK